MTGEKKEKKKKDFKITKCHCKVIGHSSSLQRKMTKAMNNSEKIFSEK